MIANPDFINCIYNIKDGYKALKNINIICDKEFIFKQYGSVFCFEPACEKFQ